MKYLIFVAIGISAISGLFGKYVMKQEPFYIPDQIEYRLYHNMYRDADDREERTFPIIVPGTVYCGLGNTSKSLQHLSLFARSDECCKHHDECEAIKRDQSRYGLHNRGLFPMQRCDCDNEFHRCLMNVNSWLSNAIGDIYFNNFFVSKFCFDLTPPIIGCGGYMVMDGHHRCQQPVYDYGEPKAYRIFIVPFYVRAAHPRNVIEYTEIVHNQLVENQLETLP